MQRGAPFGGETGLADKTFAMMDDHQFSVRLMQHLVVPTFVLDADGKVIIWNKACEALTGIKAADVLGTKKH